MALELEKHWQPKGKSESILGCSVANYFDSVAEKCEKPLYRVTCGDIGTKAEEVEKVIPCHLFRKLIADTS